MGGKIALVLASAALGLGAATWWPRLDADSPAPPADAPPSPQLPSPPGESIVGLGYVDVESGVAPLAMPVPGIVEAVLAREGDRVVAGQALLRLRHVRAEALLLKAEAGLTEAKVKLAQSRRAGDAAALRRRQQEQGIQAALAQESAATRHVQMLRNLGESTVGSEKLAIANDQLEAAQAVVKVERLKLDQLALDVPGEAVELASAVVQAAEADVATARQHLADHTLAAPAAGMVLRVHAALGQMIGANPLAPALWFRPDEALVVRVEIDQAFADQAAPGMRAEIFDDNRRNRLAAGTVRKLAPWIAQRRTQLDEPNQRNDVRTLECLVAVDGGDRGLRIGQRLRVVLRAAGVAAAPRGADAAAVKPR